MSAIQFSKLNFSFADAETEFKYNPELFKEAFYDPNGYLTQLTAFNNPKSIVVGRKGVGKTAFAAKIRTEFPDTAHLIDLHNIPFRSFKDISDNRQHVKGSQRYIHVWYILIVLRLVKIVYQQVSLYEGVEKDQCFLELVELFEALGYNLENENEALINDVIISSKKSFKVRLTQPFFEVSYEQGVENEQTQRIREFSSISELGEFVINLFRRVNLSKELYLVIDGVDDFLRSKEDTVEIIGGLTRAVTSLNNLFFGSGSETKIILLLREDILRLINDPDLNKITRDSMCKIHWNESEQLLALLNLRFKFIGYKQDELEKDQFSAWNSFFPRQIRNTNSWDYFLKMTLSRPRDILQFISEVSSRFPEKNYLNYNDFNDVMKSYSTAYFYQEMVNELSGFLDESIIQALNQILRKLGRGAFSFAQFRNEFEAVTNIKDADVAKDALTTMFELSYIGMIRKIRHKNQTKTFINFKNKDTRISVDFENQFLLHQGLHQSLNV